MTIEQSHYCFQNDNPDYENIIDIQEEEVSFACPEGIREKVENSDFSDFTPGSNFSNCDFSKLTFNRVDLSGINFENSNFTSSDLRKTNFNDSNLQGTSFQNADLSEATFVNANLDYANLQTEYINQSNMREKLKETINLASNKPKVFCIGLNKTGTTSMAKTLNDLGFLVGSQRLAELLLDDWVNRDFRSIINYCYTAQAFQDIPFSLPYSFQALDGYFPNSKFILTIRDNAEQWYNSLTQFHAKFFGKGKIPTINDLKEADYIYPGYIYKIFKWTFNTPEEDPYNKNVLISNYEIYNSVVQDYFKFRPEAFLMINLSESDSYQKLCNFLGKPYHNEIFPHENKTQDIRTIK